MVVNCKHCGRPLGEGEVCDCKQERVATVAEKQPMYTDDRQSAPLQTVQRIQSNSAPDPQNKTISVFKFAGSMLTKPVSAIGQKLSMLSLGKSFIFLTLLPILTFLFMLAVEKEIMTTANDIYGMIFGGGESWFSFMMPSPQISIDYTRIVWTVVGGVAVKWMLFELELFLCAKLFCRKTTFADICKGMNAVCLYYCAFLALAILFGIISTVWGLIILLIGTVLTLPLAVFVIKNAAKTDWDKCFSTLAVTMVVLVFVTLILAKLCAPMLVDGMILIG